MKYYSKCSACKIFGVVSSEAAASGYLPAGWRKWPLDPYRDSILCVDCGARVDLMFGWEKKGQGKEEQ